MAAVTARKDERSRANSHCRVFLSTDDGTGAPHRLRLVFPLFPCLSFLLPGVCRSGFLCPLQRAVSKVLVFATGAESNCAETQAAPVERKETAVSSASYSKLQTKKRECRHGKRSFHWTEAESGGGNVTVHRCIGELVTALLQHWLHQPLARSV